METNPTPADDLNELAQQLAGWQPSAAGLDVDRMLFAAGRNSIRPARGRRAWQVASGCLAMLAAVLAAGLLHERGARLDLLAQLHNQSSPSRLSPSIVPESGDSPATEAPAANSYLAAHVALAHDPDAWLASSRVAPATGAPTSGRPILNAHSPGEMLEP